jgi:hypothetical protein
MTFENGVCAPHISAVTAFGVALRHGSHVASATRTKFSPNMALISAFL